MPKGVSKRQLRNSLYNEHFKRKCLVIISIDWFSLIIHTSLAIRNTYINAINDFSWFHISHDLFLHSVSIMIVNDAVVWYCPLSIHFFFLRKKSSMTVSVLRSEPNEEEQRRWWDKRHVSHSPLRLSRKDTHVDTINTKSAIKSKLLSVKLNSYEN